MTTLYLYCDALLFIVRHFYCHCEGITLVVIAGHPSGCLAISFLIGRKQKRDCFLLASLGVAMTERCSPSTNHQSPIRDCFAPDCHAFARNRWARSDDIGNCHAIVYNRRARNDSKNYLFKCL